MTADTEAAEQNPPIDKYRLDEGWLEQPQLIEDAYEMLAEYKEGHDTAKDKLAAAIGRLELSIRKTPAGYGITKVTEVAISAIIACHPNLTELRKSVITWKRAVDSQQAICIGLEDRRRALENLVKLHASSYFTEPITDQAGQEILADHTRQGVRRAAQRRDAP